MKSITARVNLSSGLAHPLDRAAAIEAFRTLKQNGYHLDPSEIRAWAMANGWSAPHARGLLEYAAGVSAGKRYQTANGGWKAEIIDIWREEAANGDS